MDAAAGTFVRVHRSAAARADGAPGCTGQDAAGVLARAGVRDGQPFVLGADGSYDPALNRFFRELDAWGVRAANSVAGYARDVMLFARFLHEARGGKTIWAADAADLRAYKQVRLHGPAGSTVSVATWRRSIAALDKWAAWALAEGLITTEPFGYRDVSVWTPAGRRNVRVNTASEPAPGPGPIRFLAYPDYLLWRDVGLRGRAPDSRSAPVCSGRHGARNAAFADLLVTTGMRLGEAASLLVGELPALDAGAASGRLAGITLASAVTKRARARTVFPPARVLRGLHRYRSVERDTALIRARTAGRYSLDAGAVGVRRTGPLAVSFADGTSTGYAKLDPPTRARLQLLDADGAPAGPLALWLGSDGHPLTPAAFQVVFARANERCARAGLDLAASPHSLRHTFAVHMLGLLLRETVAALGEAPSSRYSSAAVKRLLVGNPLRRLQLLLGHANEATVYAYLDVLDEAQEIVAAALEHWDAAPAIGGVGRDADDGDARAADMVAARPGTGSPR